MKREQVITWAREAGLFTHKNVQPEIEHFAALVAAAEHEAIIDLVAMHGGPVDLEAAIRARGRA